MKRMKQAIFGQLMNKNVTKMMTIMANKFKNFGKY